MGIDYGMGKTNIDTKTDIRYGVINQNQLLQAWSDDSEPIYCDPQDYFECPECQQEIAVPDATNWGDEIECPECQEEIDVDMPDFAEPIGYEVSGDIIASCGESGDIFITKSPYYTWADFCSPCAPGAGCLTSNRTPQDIADSGGNPKDWETTNDCKAYCFGHAWFYDTETGKAPYPVYNVADNTLVE